MFNTHDFNYFKLLEDVFHFALCSIKVHPRSLFPNYFLLNVIGQTAIEFFLGEDYVSGLARASSSVGGSEDARPSSRTTPVGSTYGHSEDGDSVKT